MRVVGCGRGDGSGAATIALGRCRLGAVRCSSAEIMPGGRSPEYPDCCSANRRVPRTPKARYSFSPARLLTIKLTSKAAAWPNQPATPEDFHHGGLHDPRSGLLSVLWPCGALHGRSTLTPHTRMLRCDAAQRHRHLP